jgi:hypothetical protein
MFDTGTIIVHGAGTISREVAEVLAAARNAGFTVVFHADLPPSPAIETVIQALPPPPEINLDGLKRTHAERATPNQPWYARFQKNRRRK